MVLGLCACAWRECDGVRWVLGGGGVCVCASVYKKSINAASSLRRMGAYHVVILRRDGADSPGPSSHNLPSPTVMTARLLLVSV